MLLKIIAIFVTVPLLDLLVLLQVASYIGTLETIAIVILTGILGGSLAKMQGLKTLQKFREKTMLGETPSNPIMDGLMILLGAGLLLTPGFLTDIAGFLLLIPITRPILKKAISKYVNKKTKQGYIHIEKYP
ncbi:Protein affecting phage T7 exclusion by the F plasmid FxsA [Methanonatronarchaeum thermophilum]|uniref:Protein affecting phage T7 exclusion by the F plasmid FxsA n=1 Tax=Methanonatronarchaeum thermophilum TaxID=1927129 RepID=A0A1Y3GIY9_9EURY|nr:FxsA family protein [Methanonatronarchaeum thermophilum]OUJ19356.1 Protein affecting phage T7 exclusion by the F plasmid FxsA [Methanonatronarchaeum thermophilum]